MAEEGQKDFFISYRSTDRSWAEWIAWQLEAAGYSCLIQAWDFRPGTNFIKMMHEGIENARRTILVLSPAYFESDYTGIERDAALAAMLRGDHEKVLPIRVSEFELPGLLAPISYIDFVHADEAKALKRLLEGIQPGRPKPAEQPLYPGPASHISSPLPEYPGKSNVLIASLGDSPAAISSMYDLLTQKEKLSIDRFIILCPEDEDDPDEEVICAYEQLKKALSGLIRAEQLLYKPLLFRDVDSWRRACIFLKDLYALLSHHQEKGDTVYLSLAGGRKSMAALMAWVVPFFPCIERIYHVIDKEEQIRGSSRYFLSVWEIATLPDDRFADMMHPPLDQLILVDIPFEKGWQLGSDVRQRLTNATMKALTKGEYEEEQALITGQVVLQGGEDPFVVRVTKEVERQFDLLRMDSPRVAREVKNGLLKLSERAVLQKAGADLEIFPVKSGKSSRSKKVLRYFKGLEVPVRPVFYTDPNDIATYPDRQVNKVVVCSLEKEMFGAYRSLQDVAESPDFSLKDSSDAADLLAPPEPAESVLIVPLGTSPMVVTQLYTLLKQRELRTIREVVLIYPGQSTLIQRGAEIIQDVLPPKVRCRKAVVRGRRDMDSPEACREFQQVLEGEIERVRREYPLCKIDLALSGGRKGMTAMAIFAAQHQHISYVYHTLITDEDLDERIEKETTIERLNDTSLTEQQLKARLFLEAYESYPYPHFTLFRVPVFPVEAK